MLTDRDHLRGADRTGLDLVDQAGDGRHVAVLEPDPRDRVAAFSEVEDLVAVGDRRAQWLLDEAF